MRLYVDTQFISPYAMSVFVSLQEKSLPFELITIDLINGANHEAGYAQTSLTQRVPTLMDGDFALSESSAITEYLEEAYPGVKLYPAERQARARARQIQAWLRSDLIPIRHERSAETVFYRPTTTPLSVEAKAAANKLFALASTLLMDGQENLFGTWSIADVDLAMMLNRLVLNGDEVPPILASYAHRQWQRPAVQRWVQQSRPPL